MTIKETRDLKDHIASGGKFEMIPCNVKPNYEIKKCEAHLIHVSLENKRFNPETGERESKPYRQCFYVDDFERMSAVVKTDKASMKVPENAFAGLELIILHDPRRTAATKEVKPVDYAALSDKEIREEYLAVTGNEADAEDTKEMLIILIKEHLSKV